MDNSGIPDTAFQVSRNGVQTAVKKAGLHFPHHCVVVKLAPVAVHKEGPAYDLPIAILLAGFLPHEEVEYIPVKTLTDLFNHLSGRRLIEPSPSPVKSHSRIAASYSLMNFLNSEHVSSK